MAANQTTANKIFSSAHYGALSAKRICLQCIGSCFAWHVSFLSKREQQMQTTYNMKNVPDRMTASPKNDRRE